MDLGEILDNPLFVPLLVAFITILGNAYLAKGGNMKKTTLNEKLPKK